MSEKISLDSSVSCYKLRLKTHDFNNQGTNIRKISNNTQNPAF